MANLKKKSEERDPGLADPTFEPGAQTTDPGKEKVLPRSTPEEVAPVPDAAGKLPSDDEPEASESGYRVAPGKSITASTGDVIDAGAEITEKHLPGGAQRLEELVKSGHVVKTQKGKPASDSDAEANLPPLHGVDGNQPAEPSSEPSATPHPDPNANPADLGPSSDNGPKP